MSPPERTIDVPAAADGRRLDQFLAEVLGQSRSRVQRRIASGDVHIAGRTATPSLRLTTGDRVQVDSERPAEGSGLEPEPFQSGVEVLAEARDYLVLVKPAGVVVHPGAGHDQGTLSHQLLSRYPEVARIGHPLRPGIVHRLDVGTSGVMVVARSERGYLALSEAFASRRVHKRYLAVVYGDRVEEMEIDLPIGRHPRDRKRMAIRAGGRRALSRVRPLASGNGLSLVEVELHTGRTHQIRVHLKAAKHPLIGDPTYGEARWKAFPTRDQPILRDFPRPALHAWKLAFPDLFPADEGHSTTDDDAAPDTGTTRLVRYTRDAPEDMHELWSRLVGPWPL